MSRIATGVGDRGLTGLADGQRLAKSSPRIRAYGDVDELNALLGLVLARDPGAHPGLARIQRELFDLGADLALADGAPRITKDHIHRLDAEIDAAEKALPPLKRFILPGGAETAALLHLARTVCRRAERELVALNQVETVEPQALVYLNRLSDLLFLRAREANARDGRGDTEVRF